MFRDAGGKAETWYQRSQGKRSLHNKGRKLSTDEKEGKRLKTEKGPLSSCREQ